MADTPKGETVTPEALENNATPTAAPVANAVDPAEVERLKKEAEQARMRANQLENELAQKKKAEEEAEAAKLEQNQEYKTLLEQERAKREELEREREAEVHAKELAAQKAEVLKDYPDEVKGLAEDAGIELADTTDEAVTAFKERLDRVSKHVNVASVTPNNPNAPTPAAGNLTPQEIHDMLQDPKKTDEYFKKNAKDYPITNLMTG